MPNRWETPENLDKEAEILLIRERNNLIRENEMLREKLLDARLEADELADEVDRNSQRIDELIEENRELIEENDKLMDDLDSLYEHVDDLNIFINTLMEDDLDE